MVFIGILILRKITIRNEKNFLTCRQLFSIIALVFKKCASGSVGRAQPCQGWGRGFESRLALLFLYFFRLAIQQIPGTDEK